jgi:hypothetical protein
MIAVLTTTIALDLGDASYPRLVLLKSAVHRVNAICRPAHDSPVDPVMQFRCTGLQ